MDYIERLRRLTINDERMTEDDFRDVDLGPGDLTLDPKTLALARIAALVAVGGAGPSFGSLADAAVGAGATAPEIVDVLVGIVTIVGVPKVVAAAPEVAMALGHDLDEEGAGEFTGDWRD